MDAHSLDCLDFPRIREMLGSFALTSLGRALSVAMKPSGRPELIRRWLMQVDELRRAKELRGLPPLAGVSDIREILSRSAPPLRLAVEDVARVGRTLAATHDVSGYLSGLPEEFGELRHLLGRIGDFSTIARRIGAVIDDRGQVRSDASPKLARLRSEIDDAIAQSRGVVDRLLGDAHVRRMLQYPNYTLHNDRLVFPLRSEYRGRMPGIVHRSSDSGATLYVEPAQAVELNNRISNLRGEEAEEIARLLWDLVHEIHLNQDAIAKTLDALAVLDLIVAKLRFLERYELRCPHVLDEPLLHVREARHPLLMELRQKQIADGEQTPIEIVPIDYRLGDDFDLLIVTGPNTGGKTVALKTVGLLSLMVQSGLPAPVGDGSRFGVFRNIQIDIGDEQSMQQSLSTFSAHLRRQMDMLREAGTHTLVLIDELGAGTDPDEGAAIGRAILDELARLQSRVIVTTHIGALKSYALSNPRSENACVEFDLQTLRPTYHLRIGEPGASNAIEIAQRLGMPRRLVEAARRNLSRRARTLRTALEGTVAAKRRAEDARQAAESAQLEAGRAQVEADAAKAKLEQQQADFHRWVQRVVHLQPGDAVRVRNFDRDGRIVRLRLDQQRAEVDVGAFSVEVPLGDVLPPQTPLPPPRPPVARPAPTQSPREVRRPDGAPGMRSDGPRRADGAPGKALAVGEGASRPRDEHRPPHRHEHRGPPREERPRPLLPSLTPEQGAALQAGDIVIAKRFHREGRVVRINSSKGLAIVSVGLLQLEVPFNGLAFVPKDEPAPKPIRHPESASVPPAGASPASDAAQSAVRGSAAAGESTPSSEQAPRPHEPAPQDVSPAPAGSPESGPAIASTAAARSEEHHS
ncbi:MAG: MutS2/Smr-associated SH3 domain-containing protein [Phycisphaerae bacterium]